MRLVISVTKSAINKIEEPNNEYLLISEKPVWEVLKKWRTFILILLNSVLGLLVDFLHIRMKENLKEWATKNTFLFQICFQLSIKMKSHHIDYECF